MSFLEMKERLKGDIPGIGIDLSKNLVNEALGKIYDEQMWSFQFREAGWLTPGILFSSLVFASAGTITTVAYSDQIVGDATAAAAWLAYVAAGTLPGILNFQIRQPAYSLYNIVAFDGVNTLTVDRPWMEPPGSGQTYMMYQAYFPAPVDDFKRFFEVRDTTNGGYLDYWNKTRRDLAAEDPQRTIFDQPGWVVPYEVDNRAGSATLGRMLFELWPHPISILPYTFSYLRRGPLLSLNTDTPPYPLDEETVLHRSREVACLWKEAHKGEGQRRDMGTDWKFLAQAHHKEYVDKLAGCKRKDRDLVDLYVNRYRRSMALQESGEPYATITGGLNIGRF